MRSSVTSTSSRWRPRRDRRCAACSTTPSTSTSRRKSRRPRARHQQQITIREIKFRPKIAQNDYDTKKGHITRFLLGKDKVKITIMFRGREVTHPERGTALLDRLAGELSEIAVIEQSPIQDGRNMTMLLAPSKAVLAGEKDPEDGDGRVEAPTKGSRRERARAAQANGSRGNGAAARAPDVAEASPASDDAAIADDSEG